MLTLALLLKWQWFVGW